MSRRYNGVRAWDDAWDHTRAVHGLGYQVEQTREQKELLEAMASLQKTRLPLDAVADIANAVLCAYRVGREERKAHEGSVIDGLAKALREIADDYADRFDLESPSTNPGIKATIEHARNTLRRVTPS